MKLFLDTNIVLDLLQFREPWIHDTLVLFQLAKENHVEFEDAVQYFAAKREQVDYILSRDEKGLNMSDIPVMDVTEFLNGIIIS